MKSTNYVKVKECAICFIRSWCCLSLLRVAAGLNHLGA